MYTVVLDHAAAPPQLPPLVGLLVGALLVDVGEDEEGDPLLLLPLPLPPLPVHALTGVPVAHRTSHHITEKRRA